MYRITKQEFKGSTPNFFVDKRWLFIWWPTLDSLGNIKLFGSEQEAMDWIDLSKAAKNKPVEIWRG